ncbi:tripartite motif-containing protein 12A-like [Ruditapes philippinarum]|uniref:tripartite motif-containing protein 12A-like n=1 Tax=Ruditapes philippinarum TaxID=129788 RepID=UPI00295B7E5C|nr:tripartite motif-containing protein 12A-like [Ruditapes philippinarum]
MADGGEDDEVPGRVEDILCKRRVKEIMCQPCLSKGTKTVADTFCSTCNEFQCIDCSDVHNMLTVFTSHKLLNVKEANATRCDKHQKVLDLFCEDENKLCCSTCAIVDHRKCHSVVEVEKIARKMTSPSSSLEEILQEAKENAEDIARDIITSKYQLAKDVKEVQVKVRRMRDKVMRMFDDLEVSIVKRAKSLQKETLGNLEMKQSESKKQLANVTAYLETIQSIYKNGTPMQKFIARTEDLKKTGDDSRETFITGIDFLPDGKLVAVDHYNKKILVYNEELEKVGSYQLSYTPQSVVTVSEDEVAITSGKEYIKDILRVSKANENKFS